MLDEHFAGFVVPADARLGHALDGRRPMSGERCGSTVGYQTHRNERTKPCEPCRTAQAARMRAYRARTYLARGPMLIDGSGTRRRVRALARMGWSFAALGERLGVSNDQVGKWAAGDLVRRDTAARVSALYDRLWDQPGGSVRARNLASAKGWPPPMAWDDASIDDPAASPASTSDIDTVDELAVEAVLEGVRLQLAGATAHAAVHALHARGVPAAVVAERIGIQERQVERLKARDTAPHRKTNNYLGETA